MKLTIDNNFPRFLSEPREFQGWEKFPDIFGDRFYYTRATKEVVIAEMEKYGIEKRFLKNGDLFVPQMNKFLPKTLSKSSVPFFGDLIPSTSWGSSLNNLMSDKQWNFLRLLILKHNSEFCQFCGSGHDVECHEYWQYYEPTIKDQWGVQKLVGMMSLCKKCHLTQHLGFASVLNKLEHTLVRLSYINRLSKEEVKIYTDLVFERFERRSQFSWLLDLSYIKSLGILEVNGHWGISSDDKNILVGKKGEVTAICGIDWQLSRNRSDVMAGLTKEEAYE